MRSVVSASGGFINISESRWKEWGEKYPTVDLEQELRKANRWLERNPSKMWKTLRGFEAWLERAAEGSERPPERCSYEQSSHPSVVVERNQPLPEAYTYAKEEVVKAELDKVKAMLRMSR